MNKLPMYIVSVVSMILLIHNQALIQEVKSRKKINSIIKMDYIELHEEVLRLEEENQILGSFAAYKDTLN